MTSNGTPATDRRPEAAADVEIVCLGETMVAFRPAEPSGLAAAATFDRGIGGAESNVACTLARAGHATRWISRVGCDPFGEHLLRTVAATGVDTAHVGRDPRRPTGVYFRTHGERGTDLEVAYYRDGSAASAMSPLTVATAAARAGRILHLSGITAALSADCLELLRALLHRAEAGPLLSFDVNYRAGLWSDRTREGADVLIELARRADLVFVGEDEATEAWGVTGGPDALRALLPEPATLVVKQGAWGATAFTREPAGGAASGPEAPQAEQRVQCSAPGVEVVASVGAGDAFAAGFLSATLRGLPLLSRLRHGHLTAAAALTDPGDIAAPPGRAAADRLVALNAAAWGRLRLGPRWTTEEAPV